MQFSDNQDIYYTKVHVPVIRIHVLYTGKYSPLFYFRRFLLPSSVA